MILSVTQFDAGSLSVIDTAALLASLTTSPAATLLNEESDNEENTELRIKGAYARLVL